MRAFSTGALVTSVILGLLTLLLWCAMLATLADFGSSDAAGNALAQGFAAIEIILVWLLLTGLVGIAFWKGNMPSAAALAATLLLPLSAVAALFALDLLTHRHTPPYLWPLVTPALVPPLVLAFCFWALLPTPRTLIAPRVALIGSWGGVLVLCIVIWPMMQVRDHALEQQDAERAKWSAAFADVAADAPLWDWTPFLLAPDQHIVDSAVATIRNLPRRQGEAEAMLERGNFPLRYIGEFDLDPTAALCEKARAQLRRTVPSATGSRPYGDIADAVDAAIVAMDWLVGHGCACDAEAQVWEATARQHRDIGYDQYRLAALRDPKALGRGALQSPERFTLLTPQSHLKAWLRFADDASLREQALAGARELDHRTDDAVEMLNDDRYAASAVLHYLPRLDLEVTDALCAAGLTALYDRLTPIHRPRPDDPRPYSELLARLGVDAPLTALQWLASRGCDADGALDEAAALVGAYQDSPDRAAMLASLQQLHRRP